MITGTGGYCIKIVANLLMVPLIIRFLGADDYGFYIFLFGTIDILTALEMGFANALIQRLSHYSTLGNTIKQQEQLLLGQYLFLGLSVLTVLAGLPLSGTLAEFFNLTPKQLQVAPLLFNIVFIDSAINLYGFYYQAVLKSHCLHRWISVSDTLQAIISTTLYLLLLIQGHGIVAIFMARLAISVLNNTAYLVMAARVEKNCFHWRTRCTKAGFRELTGISFFVFLQRLSKLFARQMDAVLLARFMTLADVGIYGFVNRIFSYLAWFFLQFIDGISPVFTRLKASKDLEKSRMLYLRISALCCFLISLFIILIAGIFPEIVAILGANRIDFQIAWILALVILPAIWSDAISAPGLNYLMSTGNHRRITVLNFSVAIVNFLLSWWLVGQIGLYGPALATTSINVLYNQFITNPLACQQLKISNVRFIREVYLSNLPPLLLAGLLVGLGRLAYQNWQLNIILFGIILIFSSVAACGLWFGFSANPLERTLILSKWNDLLSRSPFIFLNLRKEKVI